jgi:hypothetical protein
MVCSFIVSSCCTSCGFLLLAGILAASPNTPSSATLPVHFSSQAANTKGKAAVAGAAATTFSAAVASVAKEASAVPGCVDVATQFSVGRAVRAAIRQCEQHLGRAQEQTVEKQQRPPAAAAVIGEQKKDTLAPAGVVGALAFIDDDGDDYGGAGAEYSESEDHQQQQQEEAGQEQQMTAEQTAGPALVAGAGAETVNRGAAIAGADGEAMSLSLHSTSNLAGAPSRLSPVPRLTPQSGVHHKKHPPQSAADADDGEPDDGADSGAGGAGAGASAAEAAKSRKRQHQSAATPYEAREFKQRKSLAGEQLTHHL